MFDKKQIVNIMRSDNNSFSHWFYLSKRFQECFFNDENVDGKNIKHTHTDIHI